MTKLKFAFKSLYSNQVILDERKKSPWWLAIIFFILAMVCTSIPTLVTGLKTNGSSLITIGNNTLESGLQLFSLENPAMIKGPKILPSNCCNTKMNKAKYKAVIG